MVRAAVLVSGGGTNLQAILDAKGRGELPRADIALVISSRPDAFALTRAQRAGIPALTLRKEKGMDPMAYGELLLRAFEEYGIRCAVLAGFLPILPENVIRAFPEKILNVHPSLIPAFCGPGCYGLKVHEMALARGVKVTGATVHFVNEIPDGGGIVDQKAVAVLPEDTPETLQRRVMEQAEWVLLPRALEALCQSMEEGKGTADGPEPL